MSSPFEHTLRSIKADSDRGALALLTIAVALLSAWAAWLLLAEVPLYEVTSVARIEAGAAGHRVGAPAAGRVVAVPVHVGDAVAQGDVLVELDRVQPELGLEQARASIASLNALIELRQRGVATEREAIVALERADGAAASEARARLDRAMEAARVAEAEASEIATLQEAQVSTQAELRRTRAEAAQLRAATQVLRSARSRERWDQKREAQDRLATIIRLEGEIAQLEGERAVAEARVRQIEADIERHTLRAPVAGVVGELAAIGTGSYVELGQVVATIVPPGALRVVAQFEPAAALGRVSPGQPAALRLTGFPWTQYGVVTAHVTRVASEVREGRIRVELAIDAAPTSIPIEHGLPGALEIEVERTSPIDLLLRAAGKRLTGAFELEAAPAGEPAGSTARRGGEAG